MHINPLSKPFSCKEKPNIKYPCPWLYKVIGQNEKDLREAISTVFGDKELIVTKSHTSSGRKYCSLNIELVVKDEESRLGHYNNLTNHAAIKVVM